MPSLGYTLNGLKINKIIPINPHYPLIRVPLERVSQVYCLPVSNLVPLKVATDDTQGWFVTSLPWPAF